MHSRKALRKLLALVIAGLVVVILIPYLIMAFSKSDAGFALALLCFYVLNPIYSLVAGIFAGNHFRVLWYAPALPAVLFLLSPWVVLNPGETEFLYYGAAYLAIGTLSMLLTALALRLTEQYRNRKARKGETDR